jgi:hypothetical protein
MNRMSQPTQRAADAGTLYVPRTPIAVFAEFSLIGAWLTVLIGALLLIGSDPARWEALVAASESMSRHVGWLLSAYMAALVALYVAALAGQVVAARRATALLAELLAATTLPLIVTLSLRIDETDGLVVFLVSALVSAVVWFLAARLGSFGAPEASSELVALLGSSSELKQRRKRLQAQASRRGWLVFVANVLIAELVVFGVPAVLAPGIWGPAGAATIAWVAIGTAVVVGATAASNLLFLLSEDAYARSTAVMPAVVAHLSVLVLVFVGLPQWGVLYPLILAMLGAQVLTIASGVTLARGWSARAAASRAALWFTERRISNVEKRIGELQVLLRPKKPRSRWKRAIEALVADE